MLEVIPWALLALVFAGAMGMTAKIKGLEADVATAEARAADADRRYFQAEVAIEEALVPLTWTWDAVANSEPGSLAVHPARLGHYLTSVFVQAKAALGYDDVGMTEAMNLARLRDAPRRLPTRPQVPPYLASPEDVAGVPRQEATMGLGGGRSEGGAGSVQFGRGGGGGGGYQEPQIVFRCIEGHVFGRSASLSGPDLDGEPCPFEMPSGEPCRKVLRRLLGGGGGASQ